MTQNIGGVFGTGIVLAISAILGLYIIDNLCQIMQAQTAHICVILGDTVFISYRLLGIAGTLAVIGIILKFLVGGDTGRR